MGEGYFSQNMAVLRRHNPLLAEELSKDTDETNGDEIKIEAASSGAPTLILGGTFIPGTAVRGPSVRGTSVPGIYVHSKRDPEKEAERLVESAVGQAAEGSEVPALILGFGLGYAALALAAKFPDKPIIIVEKNPAIIKKALEVRDFGVFFSRSRLVFVLGGSGEGVTGALSLFESSPGVPPLVIQNRALTGLDEDWYAGVEERIKTWNSRTDINRATQKRFGKLWVRNLARNFQSIRDIPGIALLEKLIMDRDIPVFLAAAGPSLDMTASILGEIHRRSCIVAVDTSFRFLINRGIEPDFVVSVDPQYWNYRHFDRIFDLRMPAPKTCLIAESAVYPSVLRYRFGRSFLCGSFFPLGRFIEDKVDPKGELGAGGSVATSAWDFIRILGARQVWIAGLDLSFPDLKTHFRGAVFEEQSHAESGRFTTAETRNFRALRSGQPFRSKNQENGAVLTDKRLSLYASWFENRFREFPEIKNYDFSGKGLYLKNFEIKKTEEFLSLPCRREEIDSLLEEAYKTIDNNFYSSSAGRLRAEKYGNAQKALLEGLMEVKNLSLEAAEIAETAARRSRQGYLKEKDGENILKKLDIADETIRKSKVKEIAGFLFPETEDWEREIARGDLAPLTRHLEFSARFYKALSEAAAFNQNALRTISV